MNNAAAPRKVSFSFCAHSPACRGLARPAPSNEMMSIRIYRVEEEACVITQCIRPYSVADLPMDRDDIRGPDWRRTRRLRVRADSWVYRYPVLCTFGAVIVAFMLSVAMFGTRRDNPRTRGNFEILAGCCLVWNAISVAIRQGPQAQTEALRTPRIF